TERRKRLVEAAIYLVAATSQGSASQLAEGALASILNDFTNVTAEPGKDEAGEADYDSGGVDIAKVLYDYNVLAVPDSSFESNLALGSDDAFSASPAVGSDHHGTTALNQSVETGGSGYRYARLRDRFKGSYEGPMTNL